MITIRQLMEATRECEPVSISPEATVFDGLKLMAEKNVGAVNVVENDQMVGIFTERDYARKIILMGRCSLDVKLKDIMTKEMVTANPETTLEECMALMTKFHIRHLPVLSEGRLIGLVSMRDVVAAIISKKEDTIENLENYILGQGYNR